MTTPDNASKQYPNQGVITLGEPCVRTNEVELNGTFFLGTRQRCISIRCVLVKWNGRFRVKREKIDNPVPGGERSWCVCIRCSPKEQFAYATVHLLDARNQRLDETFSPIESDVAE